MDGVTAVGLYSTNAGTGFRFEEKRRTYEAALRSAIAREKPELVFGDFNAVYDLKDTRCVATGTNTTYPSLSEWESTLFKLHLAEYDLIRMGPATSICDHKPSAYSFICQGDKFTIDHILRRKDWQKRVVGNVVRVWRTDHQMLSFKILG